MNDAEVAEPCVKHVKKKDQNLDEKLPENAETKTESNHVACEEDEDYPL